MPRTPDPALGPLTRSPASAVSVVVHGHFYQPPREDPSTGQIPDEPTATPFDNWNERITAECYAPLARGGLFDWLSFDLGPTLARWLERQHPTVHDAIVEGDRRSRDRLGHGNAVAQPYHHIILPLATAREKATEIRWGLLDFERRFGRPARGMWLPETAVDRATLSALSAQGIAFTILAPNQVSDPPPGGVGRVTLEEGREIAVFVYDGELSHGVAFGALLAGEDTWFERMQPTGDAGKTLIALAADGETFGHHHEGADRTLARVLEQIRRSPALEIENFASYLARAGQLPELTLVEPSSWSCAHGVGRWSSDCGCKMAPERSSQQRWRRPLRGALDALAAGLDGQYRTLAPACLRDPGDALEGLGRALGGGSEHLERYAGTVAVSDSVAGDACALLEVMRDRASMFTSCAWFFDDVAGIEATQALRYAAHALTRLAALDPEGATELERQFVATLAEAPSNDPDVGDAARVYAELADAGRLAAGDPLAEADQSAEADE